MAEAPSITCPTCGMTSSNPNDIAQRYCGNCHAFHDEGQYGATDNRVYSQITIRGEGEPPPAIKQKALETECLDCNVNIEIFLRPDGMWALEVAHDEACPWLVAYEDATKAFLPMEATIGGDQLYECPYPNCGVAVTSPEGHEQWHRDHSR